MPTASDRQCDYLIREFEKITIMRRVVITGMGVVSSLGNDIAEVTTSLREGKSGIQFCDDYAEIGMRSQIAGRNHRRTD